jgi:hypothetical protein
MVVQAELRTWHMYVHSRLKVSRKILDQLRVRYDSDMMLQDFEAKNQKVVTTFEVDRERRSVAPSNNMFSSAHSEVKILPVEENDFDEEEGT